MLLLEAKTRVGHANGKLRKFGEFDIGLRKIQGNSEKSGKLWCAVAVVTDT